MLEIVLIGARCLDLILQRRRLFIFGLALERDSVRCRWGDIVAHVVVAGPVLQPERQRMRESWERLYDI